MNRYNLIMNDLNQLENLIERIGHLHRSRLREFAYSSGLNLRQLESLIYLTKCNHYSDTPLALTEYLGLTKGTVSQTVLSLEKKKLLRKVKDKNDARIQHLQLTSTAQKLVERCTQSSDTIQAVTALPDLRNQLNQILLVFLKTMQRARKSRTFSICYTCAHFRRDALEQSHQCGLTGEPLHERESLRICREHTDVTYRD